MRLAILTSLLFATAVAAPACSTDQYDELAITCEGKCDGLSSVRALVADAKKLDLNDLKSVAAGFATQGLNDALGASNFLQIQLQPTELYAPSAVASQDLTLKDINALVSGLASKFGESALSTEINKVRADYLAQSGKRVYAESAFRIQSNLGASWSYGTSGFGADGNANVTVGFDAGAELEARVISVHDREGAALTSAPLAAIKASRGFVIPRSIDDVKHMAPGESFALAGRGKLGLNLGAGVPILIANPASWLTYSLVVSAGMRSLVEGEMDVQLVHAKGDQVVVDVGIRKGTLKEAHIALDDGWGISGLLESSVEIAGKTVDLGKLLDKALAKKVNDKLSFIEARAERTSQTMRMSVARLRFDLAAADPTGAREQALAQALKGDVRLAQALAARGDAGVVAEFDMVRSGASAISYAGIDVLGMSFYRRSAASQGEAVLQTPGGVLAMMWESLHRASGWFFTSHGFTRVGVAGLKFDARTPGVAKGETNLFLQTQEGDSYMEEDKVIDQLDSVIVAVGGFDALRAIERNGNELERRAKAACPGSLDKWTLDSCNTTYINSSEAQGLKAQAIADFQGAITGLPAESQDLLMAVADLRLSAQEVREVAATFTGPKASVVVDFRLDDAALKGVFAKDQTAYKNAVLRLMEATAVDRTKTDIEGERDDVRDDATATAEKMAKIFNDHREQYQRLLSIDGARIATLGEIGANAIEVRYTVDSNNRPKYDDAISESVAQARAGVLGSLFDDLREEADDMPDGPHAEQLAAFSLLSLAAPGNTELRVNMQTAPEGNRYSAAGFQTTDVFAKGAQASTIAAGLFDIDAIIQAPQ
jgi:hypothetical protein